MAKGGRLRSITMLLIFDVGGPLAAYALLRSAGMAAWAALLLSGVFPTVGLTINVIAHRRLDVVGALVLAGIIVGTVTGLVSHSARLLLIEGSVPTAVFGLASLGSLRARHTLMFSMAREFIGPDTAQGQEMTRLSQYDGFRRVFRVITVVWGVVFLLEAALRVVIIYSTSTGSALTISKVMPFVFLAVLLAWTRAYGTRQKNKERTHGQRSPRSLDHVVAAGAALGEFANPPLFGWIRPGECADPPPNSWVNTRIHLPV